MPLDYLALEKHLQLSFREPALLEQALIHRSYLNEHPECPTGHNERLEFLGDAVLELVVTESSISVTKIPKGINQLAIRARQQPISCNHRKHARH